MKKISFVGQLIIAFCLVIFLWIGTRIDSQIMANTTSDFTVQFSESPLVKSEITALKNKMWTFFAGISAFVCGLAFVIIKKINAQNDTKLEEQESKFDQLNEQLISNQKNLLVHKALVADKVQQAEILNRQLQNLFSDFQQKYTTTYKTRFLFNQGHQLMPVMAQDIAYFFTQNKVVYVIDKNNQKYYTDQSLEELMQHLNPGDFFRANRQFILSIQSIRKIHHYGNAKLKIEIYPACQEMIIISKAKVREFKNWVANPQTELREATS